MPTTFVVYVYICVYIHIYSFFNFLLSVNVCIWITQKYHLITYFTFIFLLAGAIICKEKSHFKSMYFQPKANLLTFNGTGHCLMLLNLESYWTGHRNKWCIKVVLQNCLLSITLNPRLAPLC